MKKLVASLLVIAILPALALKGQPAETMLLWPNGAPGALGDADKDKPSLTPYWPEPSKRTGAAVVVFPGGGYGGLAGHEGKDYALWFNEQGIAGFVVKYRLGSAGYRHPCMLQDAARAVRIVRANAAAWGLDPKRVGVIGSSAGGHLASTILTHYDSGTADSADVVERQSSRPDLGILCYPVITMTKFTHGGSRRNLLGDNPSPELVILLSNELQVTSDTPTCFVWSTYEDSAVPVENSLEFAAALRKAGVPCDLHVYLNGPHGIGLGKDAFDPSRHHPWTYDCSYFLKTLGFTK